MVSPVPQDTPADTNEDDGSPTLYSRFSSADTLLTSASLNGDVVPPTPTSAYTANTGGRARQLWRSGQIFDEQRVFQSKNPSSSSNSRQQSNRTTNSSAIDPCLAVPVPATPPLEVPVTPVTQLDEPRSFFDSGSDSSSDHTPWQDATISRASSVRVQRPQIINHHSSVSGYSPRIYGQTLAPEAPVPKRVGPWLSKAQQILGHSSNNLEDLTTASTLVGDSTPTRLSSISKVPPAPAVADAATITPPYTRLSISIPNGRTSVIEIPDTPTRAEALDTLPSPLGGFGSVRFPHSSRSLNISPIDGLRSNPTDMRLNRSISAPPLPSHHVNRHVRIRPSDLVVADTMAGHHRLFRESVVSTPYPTRNGIIANQEEQLAQAIPASRNINRGMMAPEVVSHGHNIPIQERGEKIPEKDRFPSPYRRETLSLELDLAGHEFVKHVVEVHVDDRGTFDDEALFKIVRRETRGRLLGWARSFLAARKLSRATSGAGEFDSVDFMRHLRSPKIGRKRKSWVVWLRTRQAGSRKQKESGGLSRYKTYFSPSLTPKTLFVKSGSDLPPQLTLHYEFSASRIAMAVFLVLMLSCLATVLWVLFGLPGQHAGESKQTVGAATLADFGWRTDAEHRVLTGLVLGVLVFLFGSMGVTAWIVGSTVLL